MSNGEKGHVAAVSRDLLCVTASTVEKVQYFSDNIDKNSIDKHAPFRSPLTEKQLVAQVQYWEEGDPELSHVNLTINVSLASDEKLAEQQEYNYPENEFELLMKNIQWEEEQDDSQQYSLKDRDYEYNIGIIGSPSVYNSEHPTPEADSIPSEFFDDSAYELQYLELNSSIPVPYQQELNDSKDELGADEVETLGSLYAQALEFERGSEPHLPSFYLTFSQPSSPDPFPLLPPTATPSRGIRVNTDTPSRPRVFELAFMQWYRLLLTLYRVLWNGSKIWNHLNLVNCMLLSSVDTATSSMLCHHMGKVYLGTSPLVSAWSC
ncbi:hypothetical protein C8Q75DRAFT_729989 [Abortiporus biennis]|nr:hypothetical protein C8Q75DRAFT_729989 [Abortiporus biennis]